MKLCYFPPLPPQRFEAESWSLSIDGIKQECVDKQMIYEYTYGYSHSRQYWHDRHLLTDEQFYLVDWELIGKGLGKWEWGKRKWMAKFLSGTAAVGRNMARRGEWTHDKCPRCDQLDEDYVHVIECSKAKIPFKEAMEKFLEQLEYLDTHPTIISIIKSNLRNWPYTSPISPQTIHNIKIRRAYEDQGKIGWRQFLWGRLAHSWTDAQLEWINRINTRWKKSVIKWKTMVIRGIGELIWHMWEHRNYILYHPNQKWNSEVRKERIQDIVYKLSLYQEDLFLPEDRGLFTPYLACSPRDIEKWPDDKQTAWLDSVCKAYARKNSR